MLKVAIGMVFGKLTVVKQCGNLLRWDCQCACGNIVEFLPSCDLLSGHDKSCGCLVPRHGMRYHPAYKSWQHMKDRCLNPNNQDYHNYGARGITVHSDFIKSFPIWLEAIGERPEGERWSIGRINNNGDYTYGNMRWENDAQQARNHSRLVTNTSGITGVYKRNRVIRGNVYSVWIAAWKSEDGKSKSKDFSCNKYGEEQAKQLAINYRNQRIEELNAKGFEYAETHGSEKVILKPDEKGKETSIRPVQFETETCTE